MPAKKSLNKAKDFKKFYDYLYEAKKLADKKGGMILMDEYILKTQNLSKSFGKIEVLHDIELTIKAGESYGLVGQNGAGKTTLMRLICGLMKPTKGSVKRQMGKSFIGYMPQSCRFDDGTTVTDTIRFFAGLRSADAREGTALAKKLKLDTNKKVKHLSPGQQKKLQMVIAMTGEPDFYVLDEPTAGLDPNATFEMKRMIKSIHDKGKSIMISSHILQDMDEICTNIAIMENGRLTYDNMIESCYIIKTSGVPDQVVQGLSSTFKLALDELGTTLTARITKEEVSQLISALCSQDINVYEVSVSNVKNIVQEQLHFEEVG